MIFTIVPDPPAHTVQPTGREAAYDALLHSAR
jgi:hypothetical protein